MKFYGAVMLRVTECIVTVLLFLFAGRLLDQKNGTSGRYLTIGTLLGSVIGLVRMSMSLKKISDEAD